MKYFKVIKKWAKLRYPDKKFADTAVRLYESLGKRDQELMLQEATQYIDGVERGIIIPSVPKIPIKIFKK